MPLAVIGGGMMVLGGGSPVEQAGVDQKNLTSFVNPGRVILGGGSPVAQAGIDQKNLNNPGEKIPIYSFVMKNIWHNWPEMDAVTGQRPMAPKSQLFAETSYLEPAVVSVAGVYVWPVGGWRVADGDGRVPSSDNHRVLTIQEARLV